jgi:hypothetical protein
MILDQKQRGIVKDFIGVVQGLPLEFEKQEKNEIDGRRWCSDWWTIEVLKCLYWTKEPYLLDTLPNRLKNNIAFVGREEIVTQTESKLRMMDELEKVKDLSDILYVCEVGRGVDILLALMIKEWSKIICYDINPHYVDLLPKHFPGKSIEIFRANSGDIDFINNIKEPLILIADNHRLGKKGIFDIANNPTIKAAIIEGALIE